MKALVEVYRMRRRVGWMALVWADGSPMGMELRRVVFVEGGSEEDAWWAAQEWVALHGGGKTW